jgi:hypothetical protein
LPVIGGGDIRFVGRIAESSNLGTEVVVDLQQDIRRYGPTAASPKSYREIKIDMAICSC